MTPDESESPQDRSMYPRQSIATVSNDGLLTLYIEAVRHNPEVAMKALAEADVRQKAFALEKAAQENRHELDRLQQEQAPEKEKNDRKHRLDRHREWRHTLVVCSGMAGGIGMLVGSAFLGASGVVLGFAGAALVGAAISRFATKKYMENPWQPKQ